MIQEVSPAVVVADAEAKSPTQGTADSSLHTAPFVEVTGRPDFQGELLLGSQINQSPSSSAVPSRSHSPEDRSASPGRGSVHNLKPHFPATSSASALTAPVVRTGGPRDTAKGARYWNRCCSGYYFTILYILCYYFQVCLGL